MAELFHLIQQQADTTHVPRYQNEEDLTQTLQSLHLSEMLGYEDDGADAAGHNDIDISGMLPGHPLHDCQIGSEPSLQQPIRELLTDFQDIFSCNVKGKAMDVPPMEFTVDEGRWQTTPNRLPARHVSVEKHNALNKMIDDLLELGVIQPSKATAWSQVHLVSKPTGGWRFTIDFRNLNKVISNEGWQIPDVQEMLQRIGAQMPAFFAVADLTSGFFQMPLWALCRIFTAFITFRGIFEWTRVPMGLLPSANFFQKSMGTYVLQGLLYKGTEVYIDDMLFFGRTVIEFIENARAVFQRCREKNVTLNAKKLLIGFDKIQFVGHELDAQGINMTQKRIESTIAFTKPSSLKELQAFLGLVNYFRNHLRDHSLIAQPLYGMVTEATKHLHKVLVWTEAGSSAFQRLKDLVNNCPKLYFPDYALPIVLYTDASDYAHGAYLCQLRTVDGVEIEEPIRFLGGTFHGPQVRWSTIEKEAYAIHFALRKLDDLIGGVHFTIRTDHRNLLFMNNHGSRKVLQWKLDIQHYDATIEHVPGKANIPADVFSRLVDRDPAPIFALHHIVTTSCSATQRALIEKFHTYLRAHFGVDRTIALMSQYAPDDTSDHNWPTLRQDVRQYIQCCPTCQKMDVRKQVIHASRFVLSALKPMERIAIDTIGPLDDDMGFKYIVVIIDTFTRYIELFPKQDVTAMAAADALFKHMCRFNTPREIVTDFGSQFVNHMLTHFFDMTGIKHHSTIPYSKEENGIVERANKEVNRHIRNMLFDFGHFKNWTRLLAMTEKILNSSVKGPLGVSPNTLLFGAAFPPDNALIAHMDREIRDEKPRSIRDYVDTLITRQSQLIEAAIKSQMELHTANLKKRYAHYKKAPKLRDRFVPEADDHTGATSPVTLAFLSLHERTAKPPIFMARKWIGRAIPNSNDFEYFPQDMPAAEVIDTVSEIDMQEYVHTTYEVNDFVLRRYPPTKIGGGNPHKYGSWWRGPYLVTQVFQKPISDINTKPRYVIRNLTDSKEYVVDVTHLRPFYYDPEYVTPLNVAAKDTDEEVVQEILQHDFSDFNDKRWLVRWGGDQRFEDSWERFHTLKDVEVFQHYCASRQLDPFPPKAHAQFSASAPNLLRKAGGPFILPVPPPIAEVQVGAPVPTGSGQRKRGRPRK